MKAITIPRLRAEATRQLLNYRRNHSRVYRCATLRTEGGTMLGWVRAIDEARAYFKAEYPIKERFMVRLFGLETPLPRNQPARERMLRLGMELCIAESTLYKWREDVLEVVLYAAIEVGVVRIFGLRTEADDEQEQEEQPCD